MPDPSLAAADPEIAALIERERARQSDKLQMIPSESLCPEAVLQALATPLSNKYAEGYPSTRMSQKERHLLPDVERYLAFHRRYGDRRFYKGTEFADFVEALAQKRCAEVFATKKIPAQDIFVNVQPLSGAPANNAVYEAFVKPGDRIMGMHLSYGGHLTHGSPFNRSGKTFKVAAYVTGDDGKLDFKAILAQAKEHKPAILVGGASAYPWTIDWTKLREIADEVDAMLLADISHPAGLVVAGYFPNPVGVAHVTMFTTHKTLCGPRGAVLLSTDPYIARKLDSAVFPGEQGGPHVNSIAAKAVCFGLAQKREFRELQQRIIANMQTLTEEFKRRGLTLAFGGSNTHLCLIDLRGMKWDSGVGLTADVATNILDLCGITCNKNALPGDATGVRPSGIRFGSVVLSQRGMGAPEMRTIAALVDRVLRGIEPFRVRAGTGMITRGKIDYALMREVRAEVAKLTGSKPVPARTFAVRGERARSFLDQAAEAAVGALKEGESGSTAFLNPAGEKISDARVQRLKRDDLGRDRYVLQGTPELRAWLTALSDGFVRVDDRDLYAKVHGPVAVEVSEETIRGEPAVLPVDGTKPFYVGGRRSAPSKVTRPVFEFQPTEAPLKKTPLTEIHTKMGARMLPFAGHSMPGWYTTVAREHAAVRKAAGLFDVSHMGTLEISGEAAAEFLDTIATNFVLKLEPGESQYSYIVDVDGKVMDDVIIYRMTRERFMMVVNASNQEKIWEWLTAVNERKACIDKEAPGKVAPGPVKLRRLKDPACGADQRVDLAFQGPASRTVLKKLMTLEDRKKLRKLGKFEHFEGKIAEADAIISRTGYTGQSTGFEIFVHPDRAVEIWNLLLETGKDLGVLPTGLGARDSTRAEAGFPLYGHELAGEFDIIPAEAGYGGFVKRHKPFFVGKGPLLAREEKQTKSVVRFKMKNTGIKAIRAGDPVLAGDSKIVGVITSAVLVEKVQIGLAYVDRSVMEPGTEVSIALLPRKGEAKYDPSLPREAAVVLPRFASFE